MEIEKYLFCLDEIVDFVVDLLLMVIGMIVMIDED